MTDGTTYLPMIKAPTRKNKLAPKTCTNSSKLIAPTNARDAVRKLFNGSFILEQMGRISNFCVRRIQTFSYCKSSTCTVKVDI